MWMRDAIAQEKLPAIDDLDNPKYFPYRWGHAVWAYIAGRWGDAIVADLLAAGIAGGSPAQAIPQVLGLSEEDLSAAWHAALRQTYEPFSRATRPPRAEGRTITGSGGLGDELNVSPALSPDGRRVAFLSARDLFSIDLYVADVDSGRIVRRLTSTAVDPHFESLQFIASAGTWDPSGTQLAVAAVSGGKPELAIYDVDSGRRTREIELSDLDAATNPAWSPDGRRIAFIGLTGGVTDLYVVNAEGGVLTRLTDDPFAELQPSWSPDGTRLALATDRFTTQLAELSIGSLQLAIVDVASKGVQPVRAFPRSKHLVPHWAADGGSLYFVADPTGISNVHRVGLDGSDLSQITNISTGVSGITESSPALSAAANRLVFTVFDDGAYRLNAVDSPASLAEASTAAAMDAALLPPVKRSQQTLTRLLSDPAVGLPAASTSWPTEAYRPRLNLDFVGQPTVAVGVDRFGAYGGGGMSLYFSDMLGDHTVAAAVQNVSTLDGEFSVNDIGGALVYQNLRRRWNWAVALDQTPYRTGFATERFDTIDGEPALVQETVLSRQTDRGLTGVVAYPFNRAQRLEFSGAYRQLRFANRLHAVAFSLASGNVIGEQREDLPSAPGLEFAQTSAALVYDTSVFGATSPVAGQRYRVEVAPTFGSLNYHRRLARLSSLLPAGPTLYHRCTTHAFRALRHR